MRRHDWPERLTAFIESRKKTPFIWGEHDCCMFSCDAIVAITGMDPARRFRGLYRDRRSAARVLREIYGDGLEHTMECIAKELGAEEIEPMTAQRGDACCVYEEGRPAAFGICVGNKVALANAPFGLFFAPLETIQRAWRVG